MKSKMLNVAVVVLLLGCVAVRAQQNPSNDQKIGELRDEISRREETARDEATPARLRELNRDVLIERRAQLRTLLNAEIDKLRAHKTRLGDRITAAEAQVIDESIGNNEAEIKSLGDALRRDLAAELPPADTPDTTADAIVTDETAAQPQSSRVAASGTATAQPLTSEKTGATEKTDAASAPQFTPTSADDDSIDEKPQLSCRELEELQKQNPKAVSVVDTFICSLVNESKRGKETGRNGKLALARNFSSFAVILLARKETPSFLVEAEEARVDKQVGGGPSNNGSTSLVVKGGTPAVLGFAVENGALTQTIDKTTVTFRGNPLGIYQALNNYGLTQSFIVPKKDPFFNFLRKTSFAVSFDTDRGSDPGVFTGTKQQLSSFAIRTEFINNRTPEHYKTDWEGFINTQATAFAGSVAALRTALLDPTGLDVRWFDPVMQQWFAETQQALASASIAQVEEVLRARLDQLPVDELSPQSVATLKDFQDALQIYLSSRDAVLDKIAKGKILTFDYTNKREVNAPDTSNFRFIYETGTENRIDITANASLTMFNSKPAGVNVNRVRDFQFAGQIDVPLGDVRGIGQFVFSFSGRYERMMEDAIAPNGMMLANTKGDIGAGQLKLSIPIKGLGIDFPISVTFANRTELIKEKEVRGNFGFTFDLDTIFAKFRPF